MATSRPARMPSLKLCTTSPTARTVWLARSSSNTIVGLIPVQNPDGRAHDIRYNGYSFDMNRDVLVGTQPEVAGRLKLLWKYPPQLFVDEHENSGWNYFFPPDADPIYHETPTGLYREIEQLYGPANEGAFQARGWRYETSDSGYDFFAQVYGDTVPTTQMGAVGMTFEQGDSAPYPARVRHQYTSALTTLFTGATHHERVLRTWRATFVQAKEQGEQCQLQPNKIYNPGNELLRPVPDRKVCGYFLLGNSLETRRVVSRLQTAHVVVERLASATVVPDFRPYGDEPRQKTLPRGTYWISSRPAAEALGPGDPQRGHLRAVPVLLRRERVEPAAARRHQGRLHRACR